jgi:AP-1 complex subunit beta-1
MTYLPIECLAFLDPSLFLQLCVLFLSFRPEILINEMKVFFVKYNDPIYVKLEKLDIMIRLANQQNIAQVLAELKE